MTAEDAAKARAEKEVAMSKLMDDMEASVETQGQYFVKVGEKVANGAGGVYDKRVLILKVLEHGNDDMGRYAEETIVSGDCVKIVRTRKTGESIDTAFLLLDYLNAKPFRGTPEEFQGRVKKSIDQTESPHKRVIETQTKETQLANSASEMIRSLPPRP